MEKELSLGNYDKAINTALKKLQTNKQKKSKEDYIYLLKEAYQKAVSKNTNLITYLKQDNNSANYETIYKVYQTLNNRQEKIKPLLPLYLKGNEVVFDFKNYNTQIIKAKEDLSSYLYNNAKALLNLNSKIEYRNAYEDFKFLEHINPNIKMLNN